VNRAPGIQVPGAFCCRSSCVELFQVVAGAPEGALPGEAALAG